MAAGPYAVDGVEDAGRGTEAAAAFLERLRAVADVHDVVALSYGDVDADALVAAGLTDVLVRSLPGTGDVPASDVPDGESPAPPAVPDGSPRSTPGTAGSWSARRSGCSRRPTSRGRWGAPCAPTRSTCCSPGACSGWCSIRAA